MTAPARIALIGVGGFGRAHLKMIDQLEGALLARLTAVVVRDPARHSACLATLEQRGVECFSDLETLLQRKAGDVDVVSIPTGLPSHETLAIKALTAGCHVFVDKPPAVTIQGLDAMLNAIQPGRFCAVTFQTLSAPLTKRLKATVVSGELGAPLAASYAVGSPRTRDYYERNAWAGKWRTGDDWVLDGPITNALSHELNAMLYLCCMKEGESARPETVTCELYRAHDIEAADTACLRFGCANGFVGHYYATHACDKEWGRVMEIQFERGVALIEFDPLACPRRIDIRLADGRSSRHVDTETRSVHLLAYENIARAVREGPAALDCPLSVARSFTLLTNGAHLSAGAGVSVPGEAVEISHTEGRAHWDDRVAVRERVGIRDIEGLMHLASWKKRMLSEMSVPWAKTSKKVSLHDLSGFSWSPERV